GRSGEYMLILIDTVDNDCKTWQLKKSTDGTITIDYEGKKYFLECFSEKKELNLYNSLFQLASELPPLRHLCLQRCNVNVGDSLHDTFSNQ
ncbi:MAG: hypothetical protein RSF82_05895, partial [Angelakisella sp.]